MIDADADPLGALREVQDAFRELCWLTCRIAGQELPASIWRSLQKRYAGALQAVTDGR